MKNLVLFILFSVSSFSAYSFIFEFNESSPNKSIDGVNIIPGTLPIRKLSLPPSPVNQNDGVLYFNGTEWVPAPLIGLRFVGSCNPLANACPNEFDLSYTDSNGVIVASESGDYFISEETKPDGSLNKRDWLIFNGTKWERINNTGMVLSIFGRDGDVSPENGDILISDIITGSSLFDFTNVEDIPTDGLNQQQIQDLYDGLEGYVLTFNGTQWSLQPEQTGLNGGGFGETDVNAGQITNEKIDPAANISKDKVSGFNVGGKLSINGGEVSNFTIRDLEASSVILKADPSDPASTDLLINLGDLKTNIETLEARTYQPEISVTGGDLNKYYSSDGTWKEFTLEHVTEGTNKKFANSANFWNVPVGNLTPPTPGATIGETTTVQEAISILNTNAGNNQSSTNFIGTNDTYSFDPLTYLASPGGTGFLHFNQNTSNNFGWTMKSAAGVSYKGEIDLSTNSLPTTNVTAGDFYIISGASGDFKENDWAIYDGSSYKKISYNGNFLTFKGRAPNAITGNISPCPYIGVDSPCPDFSDPNHYDYSWEMINFTGSVLSDISNVTAPTIGQDSYILKASVGSGGAITWSAQPDNSNATTPPPLPDGAVTNEFLDNINIAQVENLQSSLDNLFDRSSGVMSGTLNFNSNKLKNIGSVNSTPLDEIITNAIKSDDDILLKQAKIPDFTAGTSAATDWITGDKATTKDFSNIPEGSTNLYFSNEKILDSKLISISSISPAPPDTSLDFNPNSADTLEIALNKIHTKLESTVAEPSDNSVASDSIIDGTVVPNSIETTGAVNGDALTYFDGSWQPRKTSGINIVGDWDIANQLLSDISSDLKKAGNILQVTSSDPSIISIVISGVNYQVGDLLFIGEVDSSGNITEPIKFSSSEKVISFEGRGDTNTAVSPSNNDYTWDMVKDGSTLQDFGDFITPFPTDPNGKILGWNGTKWTLFEDNAGGNITTDTDIADGALSAGKLTSIDYTHVDGIQAKLDTYINLAPTTGDISFSGDLLFDSSGNHNITNLGTINSSFTISDLNSNCSIDLSSYEKILPTDYVLASLDGNGNRESSPSLVLSGDASNYLYSEDRVQGAILTDFVSISQFSDTSFNTSTNLTTLIASLEYQIEQAKISAAAPDAIEESQNVTISTPSGNVVFIKPDSSTDIDVNLGHQADQYEITIKRLNQTGGESATVKILVPPPGNINGGSEFILEKNLASVTLKKHNNEYLILKRFDGVDN